VCVYRVRGRTLVREILRFGFGVNSCEHVAGLTSVCNKVDVYL